METLLGVVVLLALILAWKRHQRKKWQQRFDQLAAQWGADVATRIMAGDVWQGATYEQIQASIGPPLAQDEKVLKTKIKHTWKYNQVASNRYALKVFFEDGVCVGWEAK